MSEPHILAEIVTFSLGAAVNPTNLTIVLLYLGAQNRPLQKGSSYYAGNFLAAFLWAFLSLIFGAALLTVIPHFSTFVSACIDAGIGFILLILGIYLFRKKKPQKHDKVKEAKKEPGIYKVFSFGFFMNMANYSSIPLLFVASKDVGLTGFPFDYQIALLLVICLIMNIMVEIPLIFYVLERQRAAKILRKANTFFISNGNIILGIYIFLIALFLLWRGIHVLNIL